MKAALRQEIRERLRRIGLETRAEASALVRALLGEQPAWQRARSVMLYAPRADEPDIWPMAGEALGNGKSVALPRHDAGIGGYIAAQIRHIEHDIRIGRFGIREPDDGCAVMALNRLDLILVPGVAFDLQGRRLGRGKGFYDQLLANVRGLICGVAFDEQVVAELPVEPHDVHLDCILTPTRWIEP